jgi:hypothetical protein
MIGSMTGTPVVPDPTHPQQSTHANRNTTQSLRNSSRARIAVRGLGALVILFVGADHYWQYAVDDYSVVPTIGMLFLLNFISATGVGLLLLAPLERLSRRFGATALKLVAFSGFGIAATSLAGLLYSEQAPLFGFMEFNYRPAIIIALATEFSAAVLLGLLLLLTLKADRRARTARRPMVEHAQAGAGAS